MEIRTLHFALTLFAISTICFVSCDDDDEEPTPLEQTAYAEQPLCTIDSTNYFIARMRSNTLNTTINYTVDDTYYLFSDIEGFDRFRFEEDGGDFFVTRYDSLTIEEEYYNEFNSDWMHDFRFNSSDLLTEYVQQQDGIALELKLTYNNERIKTVTYNWYDTDSENFWQQGTLTFTWSDNSTVTQVIDKFTFDFTDDDGSTGEETITWNLSYTSNYANVGCQFLPCDAWGRLKESPFLYMNWMGDGPTLLPDEISYSTLSGDEGTISFVDAYTYISAGLVSKISQDYESIYYDGGEYNDMTITYLSAAIE